MFIDDVLNNYNKNNREFVKLSDLGDKDYILNNILGSLSQLKRFNGCCNRRSTTTLTVLQHSLLVANETINYNLFNYAYNEDLDKLDLFFATCYFYGLIHDFGESVIGDITYCIKKNFQADCENLKLFEHCIVKSVINDIFLLNDDIITDDVKDVVDKSDKFIGSFEFNTYYFNKYPSFVNDISDKNNISDVLGTTLINNISNDISKFKTILYYTVEKIK